MQGRPWRRWLIRGAVYFAAWTLVALFFFTREASRRAYWNEPLDWGNLLLTWLVGEYIWAIVALAVLALGWRWPVEPPGLVRRIALHLVASLAFAAMQLGLEAAAYLQLGTLPPWLAQSFAHAWPALLVLGFHGNLILYWVILGVQTGYRHYTRLRDRERLAMRLELDAPRLRSQLVEAQLGALKAQLQPHFLFNTLNTITVLVRERETARAELMLARLADFLRRVLDDGTAQEVEL